MKKIIFTLLILTFASSLFAQVQITNTDIYRTAEQMLLANEINESGEPFAEELGYNLDDLDPAVPYAPDSISYNLGINNYEYSRYQLGTIVSRSGMGLHMIWAQDMLGAYHDGDGEGIEPDGTITPDSVGSPNFDPDNNVFYGGDALDGFIGQVLTAEGINKTKFILTQLAYDGTSLGMVDPMTYNPANGVKYFPHAISVTEEMVDSTMPPKPNSFTVTDDKSYLWDQFSLIWGTLNFTNMMDPDNNSSSAHTAYHSVFDGNPFPAPMSQTGMAGPYDLMKGASMVLFQNIMAMHYKMAAGSFVDMAWLDNGQIVMGNSISTVNAGYIIVALSSVVNEFQGMPLEGMALNALKMQADFIIDSLKNNNGSYANSFNFGGDLDSSPTDVAAQSAAIRGLFAAYDVTNDAKYLTVANEAYTYLIDNFYIGSKHAFKTEVDNSTAVYTPFNVALLSGALRSASLAGGQSDAALIYTRFFLNVGNAMQLSEGDATGEVGSDSDGDGIPFISEQADGLPPVFASEAILDVATGIEDKLIGTPETFSLSQNYPNPFNPTTTISFALPQQANVKLNVYNIIGEEVAELINANMTAGFYQINFDASNLSSGLYFYRISAGNFVDVKKMMLLK